MTAVVEVPPTRGEIWKAKFEIRRLDKEIKRAERAEKQRRLVQQVDPETGEIKLILEPSSYVLPEDRPKPVVTASATSLSRTERRKEIRAARKSAKKAAKHA